VDHAAQPPAPSPRPVLWAVGLCTALATVWLRTRHLDALHRGGRWWLTSGDSWGHTHRVQSGLAGEVPWTDPLSHTPEGLTWVWPPGFDWLVARTADLAGGSTQQDAIVAGLTVVAVCAALTTALAVAATAILRSGPGAALGALLAGVVAAVHGGLHNYLQAGKVDHHAVEPLLTFAALGGLVTATESARWRAWSAGAGLALALAVWCLPSSALTLGLIGGLGLVRMAVADPGHHARAARAWGLALAVAGLGAQPLALQSPFAAGGAAVAHAPSWLQPVAALVGAAAFAVAARVPHRWAALGAAIGLSAAAMGLWPAGRQAILGGSQFVAGRNHVAIIHESASLLDAGWHLTPDVASWSLPVVPLLLWFGWRATQSRPALRTWTAALAVGWLLTVAQSRFSTLQALPLAVVSGALLAQAHDAGAWGRRLSVAAVLATALLGLVALDVRTPPLAKRVRVWEALDWLRDRADRTPHRGNPPTVLASWALGHEIRALGQLPNVCSPHIAPGQTAGLDACLALHLDDGSGDTETLLDRHRVRYWLTSPLAMSAMRSYAEALGRDPDVLAVRDRDDRLALTPAGSCINAHSLHYGNGSQSPDGTCKARPAWRLAFASTDLRAKVFERVPGALVRGGGCPAGSRATVTVRLQIGQGGDHWFNAATVGPSGGFGVRVPYPSAWATSGGVRVLGVEVACGNQRAAVEISEPAVTLGLPVDVTRWSAGQDPAHGPAAFPKSAVAPNPVGGTPQAESPDKPPPPADPSADAPPVASGSAG